MINKIRIVLAILSVIFIVPGGVAMAQAESSVLDSWTFDSSLALSSRDEEGYTRIDASNPGCFTGNSAETIYANLHLTADYNTDIATKRIKDGIFSAEITDNGGDFCYIMSYKLSDDLKAGDTYFLEINLYADQDNIMIKCIKLAWSDVQAKAQAGNFHYEKKKAAMWKDNILYEYDGSKSLGVSNSDNTYTVEFTPSVDIPAGYFLNFGLKNADNINDNVTSFSYNSKGARLCGAPIEDDVNLDQIVDICDLVYLNSLLGKESPFGNIDGSASDVVDVLDLAALRVILLG